MYRLLLFTATTFSITSNDSFISVLPIFFVHSIVSLVYGFLGTKNLVKILKFFIFGAISITGPMVATLVYLQKTIPEQPSNIIIGEVTITENTKPGVYVANKENKSYFLYTNQVLDIGEKIFIATNIISPNREFYSKNLRQIQSQVSVAKTGFNIDKRMLMKGVQGSLFPSSIIQGKKETVSFLAKLKLWLKQKTAQIWENTATQALVLGMVIGDKSLMQKTDYQMFVDSGLVHLIAVSGGNIVLLVVFLNLLLFFLPFYIRNILLIVAIVGYTLLCGGDSSIVRAAIMAIIAMAALFLGREIGIWRLLSYAWVMMLLINPYYLLYDLGFLLSFAAIAGIVIVGQYVTKREYDWREKYSVGRQKNTVEYVSNIDKKTQSKNILTVDSIDDIFESLSNQTDYVQGLQEKQREEVGKIKSDNKKIDKVDRFSTLYILLQNNLWRAIKYMSPTVGATLGVLPIILYYIGGINIAGIAANFIIIPLVPMMMIGGILTIILGSIDLGVIQKIIVVYCSYILDVIAQTIFFVGQYVAHYGIYISVNSVLYKSLILIIGVWYIFSYFCHPKGYLSTQ